MKTYGDWQGFPGWWINGTERWIATEHGWTRVRARLAEVAGFQCEGTCGRRLYSGDAHHRFGRGAGKRDDRITLPDGTRNLLHLCRDCHSEMKIERKP